MATLENSYWNRNGLYQTEFDKFFNELVSCSGKCGTIFGELLRASNRLYHDFYNNGFLNNTSGAANFLDKYDAIFNLGISKELENIYPETNTDGYTDKDLKPELEFVMNAVLKFIIDNHTNDEIRSMDFDDLFHYQENDYYEPEDAEEYDYYDDE